ncbi:MAG TPA: chromate transporter [Dongiaceae bacterium]
MSAHSSTIDEASTADASLGALFLGFLTLGLMSFGGTLPVARRIMVDERRWLTDDEFTEILGLCQFLPGGNIMNTAVAVGHRFRGAAGSAAALLGLMAAPTAIVIGLDTIYDQFSDVLAVQHVFAGLAAGAAGLLVAMAGSMAKTLWQRARSRLWLTAGVTLVCFVAIALLRLPLLPTMVSLAILSTALHWPRKS